MKYFYIFIFLIAILLTPHAQAVASSVSINLTKFEVGTEMGSDNLPGKKFFDIAWKTETQGPKRLMMRLSLVDIETGYEKILINPCFKLDSDNMCLENRPQDYMLVDPITQNFWVQGLPNELSQGKYKVLIKVYDMNTGFEEARNESRSTIDIHFVNGIVQVINNPLQLVEYKPSIVSLVQENSSEYGGSIKISWKALQTDGVNLTLTGPNFRSPSGIKITPMNTIDVVPGSTASLKSEGVLYVKVENATSNIKKIWVVIDPLSNITGKTIEGRKVLEIDIPPSQISPRIESFSIKKGAIGDVIQVKGSGFTATENSLSFETTKQKVFGIKQWSLNSKDGKTIKFIIPSTLKILSEKSSNANSITKVFPGVYGISISNSNGKSDVKYITVINKRTQSLRN